MLAKLAKKIKKQNQWVLIALISSGVAVAGYFGYVQSSADVFNSQPPTVNCKKLTTKQCNKKQAESDATFYAQLNKDCAAANRIYANKSCGGCQKGFFDKDGTCKARQKFDCAAQYRFQKDDYECGKCVGGYYDRDSVCTKLAPQIVTDICTQGEVNAGCVAPVAPTTPTCGPNQRYDGSIQTCVCEAKYVMTAGNCLRPPSATEQCAFDGDGRCMSATRVKQVCGEHFLIYDQQNNICKNNCIAGYYLKDEVCRKLNQQQSSAAVRISCSQQFLEYDSTGNVCSDICKSGYVKRGDKCVDQAEVLVMSEQRCRALGRTWKAAIAVWGSSEFRPAYCSNQCLGTDNAQFVDTARDITSYCQNDSTSGSLSVSLTIAQTDCAASHRLYLAAIQACSARCVTGWYLDNGTCKAIKSDIVANETEITGGAIDDDGRCVAPLQDGVVHIVRRPTSGTVTICPDDDPNEVPARRPADQPLRHNVETDISHETCRLLGREWVLDSTSGGRTVKGGCSTQACLQAEAEARNANGSVYCEGSVDRIGRQECLTAHRVWVEEVRACAARIHQAAAKQVNAAQCEAPYTVYVQHTQKQGADECVKPNTYQRLQTIARKTGKPVSFLASMAPKGLCGLQKNKQWIDGKCVRKRVANQPNNGAADTDKKSGITKNNPKPVSCSAFHELFSEYYCTIVPDFIDDRACVQGALQTPTLRSDKTWFKPTSAVCSGIPLGASGFTANDPQDLRCSKFLTYFNQYRCPRTDLDTDARYCPAGRFNTVMQQVASVHLRSKVCIV